MPPPSALPGAVPQAAPSEIQDLQGCRALIVDGNQSYRTVMRGMLASLGVRQVTLAGCIAEGRHALEHHTFDLVLCDYHFDDSHLKGPELLDELRRQGKVPYATVFAIVTTEASPEKVAEAAESALDCYLIRPITLNKLAQRVQQARFRKSFMTPVHARVEAGDYVAAADLCLQRYQNRTPFWVDAARMGGELLLRLQRPQEAAEMFEAVSQTRAVPWARLGLARAQLSGGQTVQGRRTLETLCADHPGFADTYDVLGHAQMAAGELEAALHTFHRAIEVTPNSVARLQKVGMLAFYLGHAEQARECLEKAARLGADTASFDCQGLVVQSFMAYDLRDETTLSRAESLLLGQRDSEAEVRRNRRMAGIVHVLGSMMRRQVADVVNTTKAMIPELQAADFDFEAAGNLLGLLARIRQGELELPDAEGWVQHAASRFCTSRATTDLLCLNVQNHPPYEEPIRRVYKSVTEAAEKALTHARQGAPGDAVLALIQQGRKIHNAKLIDLADMVLQRYATDIADGETLARAIDELRRDCCPAPPASVSAAVREGAALPLPP